MTRGNDNAGKYEHLGALMLDVASVFRPPERLSVSQAAAKYRKLHNPPVYTGPWHNEKVPYMVEPMDVFASRAHKALIFCGPAQSAKTDALILNTLLYTVVCNPADFILYQISNTAARDFSKRRVDRMHRRCPAMEEQQVRGRNNDNTFDKLYKSGMMFTLSWPSTNEMSGKPVPLVALTDYDRMPMDVDGEGSPFDLAQTRTRTFRSFGMTVAESSPGKEITDSRWSPSSPHEAPPCEGILSLYNRGDRRRWYWPCPTCGEFFEGKFSMLKWEMKDSIADTARTTYMVCPKKGCYIRPDQRHDMNLAGVWLREGETINRHGVRGGNPARSDTASFWLKGVAATFVTWEELVIKQLNAEDEYRRTGSQEALKTTMNTDQGEPYLPRGMEAERLPEQIKEHAKPLPEKMVPSDVRALFALIDVQKNRWEVMVCGIAPGHPYNIVVIDRFPIIKSERRDDSGERLWVKPAAHPEDWHLIETLVMDKQYPLADSTGHMSVRMTFCDSGGKEGVTTNAYTFYRTLKTKGKHDRFMLLKGDARPDVPRARVEWPDSNRKDRFANARGEIPVLFLNSNSLKDTLNGMLDQNEEGGSRIWFPDWLGEKGTETEKFYDELTAEVKTPKGWENLHGRRNEAWDLLYYFIGACVVNRVEHVDWNAPPPWLAPWDENPFVQRQKAAKETPIAGSAESQYGLSQLGNQLA